MALSTGYPPDYPRLRDKVVDKGVFALKREGYTTRVGQNGAKWGESREYGMFLGEYLHSVDGKGRIAVPARFRSKIERGAVLTRGVDPCLYIYPMETWEAKASELSSAITDPRLLRLVERRFFGMAHELELDAQGRIVVPAKFRKYADLTAEAMVIGARDRFEIWSVAGWDAYINETQDEDLSALPLPF